MEYKVNHAGKDVVFRVEDIRNEYLRNSTLKALEKFYKQFSSANNEEVTLTYRLTDHIHDFFRMDENVIMSESAKINSNQVFMTGHGNIFGYEYEKDKLKYIYYNITNPGLIENNTSKAKSRAYLSNVENQIMSMYSRGFLHGLQLKNLENGASFLHACSFSINGNGFLVAATPGAGKSSLLLSMAFDPELDVKFISDDFACVDKEGMAYHIGRSMAIKSHQIQYFPGLKDKLDDMTQMQKLQWFLLKKRGLKRMASPRQIFRDNIATNASIEKAIYVTNHNKDTFEMSTFSAEEFADLNANMLFSELYLGMEIVNRSLILPGHHLLTTADKFINNTRENLQSIFIDIPCILVKVPFRSDPRKLLQFLKSQNIFS